MDYVNFGTAGLKVSRLAFGLGFRGQSDPDEAERVIERAIELGINFIDCANAYGLEDNSKNAGTCGTVALPHHARNRPHPHPARHRPYRRLYPAQLRHRHPA